MPVPIPTTDGRLFADGLVVMTYVEGGPPETEADWRRVADTLRQLHRLTQGWPQRPGWRSSTDLLHAETGTKIDLGAMPPEGVARCRAAWARLIGRQTCVVHGDPNPGNIRMTADRVALIDWDESHVDVPDLDLVLPHNAAGLDDDAHDIAAQASAAWEAAVCWDRATDDSQSSGSPKFERSEAEQHRGISRMPSRPRSSSERGLGHRARVGCQRRAKVRTGDGHAITPAEVLRLDQQPKRSVRAWRNPADTTPGRPLARDAVEEGEDPISDPRVCAGIASHRLSLKPGSTDKSFAARRGFSGELDGGRSALPPRKMKLDRTAGLDPPGLQRIEPPIGSAAGHPRKG